MANLTDRQIKALAIGKHADGSGLYLNIRDTGTKAWELRVQVRGVRRAFGLGAYPGVSLKQARERSVEYKKKLAEGIDPTIDENDQRAMSFKEATNAFLALNQSRWRNRKHAAQWRATLTTYAWPVFGSRPVTEINGAMVLKVLEPIWQTKTETARRVMQRIETIIDFAFVKAGIEQVNPARWKGRLEYVLPAASKLRPVKHFAAPRIDQAPPIFQLLGGKMAMGAIALRFLMLTAARSGEVVGAQWSEFDLARGVWEIPAARMKAAKEHRVPLSAPALAILGELWAHRRAELVFSAHSSARKPISDATMRTMLRRVTPPEDKLTVHGLRSTFRDWAGETTSHPREVIEAALAHQLKDKAEAAYARGDLFDKRRVLMDEWARFLVTST